MIWKGHEWSSIKCLVKVDENFRTSFAGQKPKYALRMLLENVLTNTFFSPWKHTRYFRLSFHNNIPEDMETETKSETKMIYIKENPYIDVTIEVHKALFKGGDKFRIVAAATNATQTKHKYVEDVVFGASKDIVYVYSDYFLFSIVKNITLTIFLFRTMFVVKKEYQTYY
jgi:hypothetical protein